VVKAAVARTSPCILVQGTRQSEGNHSCDVDLPSRGPAEPRREQRGSAAGRDRDIDKVATGTIFRATGQRPHCVSR
jgi:hypothetical protein